MHWFRQIVMRALLSAVQGSRGQGCPFYRRLGFVLIASLFFCSSANAQEDPEKFEKQSGALRTALHFDPSLEAPLKNLAKLYTGADRAEELLSVYRTHTTQYPQDESARVVLIRLLREMRKPDARALITKARKEFPNSSLIAYLSFQELSDEKDPRALDALSGAITAEIKPGRKRLWIDQLVDLAVAEGRQDLASKHLTALAAAPGQSAEFLVALARKMQTAKFHELVLTTLDKARAINASPELKVDIELVAATAESAQGSFEDAGKRLDALLETVAADYWRRPEIVSRRVNLLSTDAARETMLKAARKRFEAEPQSEAVALDLGELLVACELRRDALGVYLKASKNLPNSERIERSALELFDRLNDLRGSREFLLERLEKNPDRLDLEYRYVKALYAAGEADKALARYEALLARLEVDSRLDQTLELARYLRRMGLPDSAIVLFKQVVEQEPDRLDVRRELAETYMAVGKRGASRKLFNAELADGAEIENFLDVVQFMIQQEILLEAKQAITKRLDGDGDNFELRLLLLGVQAKLGDQLAGESLLQSTRLLADTEARYRSWSEAATKFHEMFETLESFLDAEHGRLVGDAAEWTPQRIARFLTFCDIADRSEQRTRVVEVIRGQIQNVDTPAALRLELRRLLVRLLDRDPTALAELQENLETLERDDAGRSDEYRLLMGKSYMDAQRPDLAAPLLEGIDFEKVGDSRLLAGLHTSFLDRGEPRKALRVLERITVLEPTNRGNWQTWLTLLAALGEEAELRYAIRRLIVGIDRMPLSEGTYSLLRGHLTDSYWRTIAMKLSSGENERLGEIFSLLDAIERSGRLPAEQLWVIWTRAHILSQQGRTRALEEALAQLEQAAEGLKVDGEAGEDAKSKPEVMIYFPDGLAVSVDAALQILREPTTPTNAVPAVPSSGPLPDLRADWAFETDGQSPITQSLPMPNGDLVVFDRSGSLYRIAGKSGKLIWRTSSKQMEEVIPADVNTIPGGQTSSRSSSSRSRTVKGQTLPQCVADTDGNVILPFRGYLLCLSGEDGRPKWLGEMGGIAVAEHGITNPLTLFVDGDQVLAYNSVTAVAASFDRRSGKLDWEREILPRKGASRPANSGYTLTDFTAGASYSDGRMLVYGRHAAIIETSQGKTVWSFEAGDVRAFPIKLASPEDARNRGSLVPNPATWNTGRNSGPSNINYLGRSADSSVDSGFALRGGSLLAPATSWTTYVGSGQLGMGVLVGKRLMLFGKGLDVLSLDLPLAGMQRNFYSNVFVGTSGNKACFLSGSQLTILNLSRNTVVEVSLAGVVDATSAELQVSIAGTRVYASGGNGVRCLNIHSGGTIFESPWPQRVARMISSSGAQGEASKDSTSMSHYWQGRIASIQPGSRFQTLGTSYSSKASSPAMPACFPVTNTVADGRLFALVAPHQIVAISQQSNNESTNTDASQPKD